MNTTHALQKYFENKNAANIFECVMHFNDSNNNRISKKYLNVSLGSRSCHDGSGEIVLSKECILILRKVDAHVKMTIRCKGLNGETFWKFSNIPKNLPNNIVSLAIYGGDFREIPVLPDSITDLIIEDCSVEKLPEVWPSKLKHLSLYRNYIEEFPKNLPKSLKHLCLAENPITKIGVLHEGLITLDMSYTDVDHLGDLPKSLEDITIRGSDIKKPDNTEWKNENNLKEYKKLNEDEEKLDAFIDEIMLDEKKLQKLIQKIESQKKQSD